MRKMITMLGLFAFLAASSAIAEKKDFDGTWVGELGDPSGLGCVRDDGVKLGLKFDISTSDANVQTYDEYWTTDPRTFPFAAPSTARSPSIFYPGGQHVETTEGAWQGKDLLTGFVQHEEADGEIKMSLTETHLFHLEGDRLEVSWQRTTFKDNSLTSTNYQCTLKKQ
jgi:hypothetical protein